MKPKDIIRMVISLALISLFGYAYLRNPSDDLLTGTLISITTTAVAWWLGSSQASSEKNETIHQMAEQATGKADDPVHITPEEPKP